MADMEFDFSKIETSINKAVGAVEKLEKRLAAAGKQTTVFSNLFGTTRQFDRFVTSVKKIDEVSAKNFTAIAEGITQLTRSLSLVRSDNNLDKVIKQISLLSRTLGEIKVTKASITNLTSFLDSVATYTQKLTHLANSVPDTKNLTRFFNSVTNIFVKFSSIKVTKASNAGLAAFLSSVAGQVQQLVAIAGNVANGGDITKNFAVIGGLFTSLSRIAQAVSKIPAGSTSASIGAFLTPLITDLVNASNLVKDPKRLATVGEILRQASRVVASLVTLTKQVSAINSTGTAALNIQNITTNLVTPLVELANKLKGVQSLATLGSGLKNLSAGFKELVDFGAKLPNGDLARLGNLTGLSTLANVARNIGFAVTQLSNTTVTTKGISSLSFLGRALSGIGTFMNSLSTFNTNAIKSSVVSRLPVIGGVFRTLGNIFKPSEIRQVSQALKGFADAFKNVKLPENLGANFSGISRLLTSVTRFNLGDIQTSIKSRLPLIGRVFTSINNVFKPSSIQQIARAMKSFAQAFKGVKFPENLGANFSGIGTFLNSLNKINLGDIKSSTISRLPLIGKMFSSGNKFTEIGRQMKKFADAFKGFKNVKVPDLNVILPAIQGLATGLQGVDFSKVNFKGFENFTAQLAKGLKNLNGIKTDSAKLNAISSALSGLSGFKNARFGIGGGIQQQAASGASGIGSSIIQNAVGQFLGQVAFSALAKVNDFIKKLIRFDSSIRNTLRSVGQSFTSFGTQMQTAGNNILRGLGLEQLLNSPLLQVASDFDKLSTQVKVFGDLTDEQLVRAQAFADEIGIQYPLSANDALKAILDLEKAGQDLNNIEFILPSAADLAALGGIELPQATQALIAAANVFDEFAPGIEGTFDNIATAADVIAGAADASTASVDEIISGLQDVGPIAKDMGLSMQEVVAILAKFNDAGIRGSEAGRNLRTILSTLVRPQTIEELAFLQESLTSLTGLTVDLGFENEDGSIKNFDVFIQNLNETYKRLGFTQAQIINSTSKLTEQFGRTGLSILLASNGYSELSESIGETASAQERAALLLDNFSGDVEQLQGSVETLTKNAFLPLIRNAFRPFVQVGRRIVDGILTFNQGLEATGEGIFNLVGNVILLTSTFATLFGGLLVGVGIVARFEGLIFRIGAALTTLVFRLPLVIAGFGSFVASFAILLTTVAAVSAAILALSVVITEFQRVITNNIGGAGTAFERFKTDVADAIGTIGPLFREIGRVANILFGAIFAGEVAAFGQRVTGFFTNLSRIALDLKFSIQQVSAGFSVFANFIHAAFNGESVTEASELNDQLAQLSRLPLIQKIFGGNANVAGLRRIFGILQRGFQNVGSALDNLFSGAIGVLFGEKGAIDRVKQGASLLLSVISKALQGLTGLNLAESILNFDNGNIRAGAEAFFRTVLNTIKNFIAQNKGVIANIVSGILTFPFNAASFILRVLGLENVAGALDKVTGAVGDIISGAVKFAIDLLSGNIFIDSPFLNTLKELVEGGDVSGTISYLANSIKDLVVGAIQSVPALISNIGTRLGIEGLVEFGNSLQASEGIRRLADALGNIASYPLEAIGNVFTGITTLVQSASGGNAASLIVLATGIATLAGALGLLSKLPLITGILLISNGLKNIQTLIDGDVIGFIRDTLGDMASDIFSFLGIEIDRETIFDRVEQSFTAFRDLLPIIVREIGNRISDAFNGLVGTLINAFNRAKAALGIGGAEFGASFNASEAALADQSGTQQSKENIFNTLGGGGLDETTVSALVAPNAQRIVDSFVDIFGAYGSVDAIPEALFDNIARTLQDSGLMERALDQLNSDDIRHEFTNRILGTGGGNRQDVEAANEVINSIADQFKTAFESNNFGTAGASTGQRSLETFNLILESMGLSNLSQAAKSAIIDSVVDNGILQGVSANLLREAQNELNNVANQPLQMAVKTQVTITATSINISPLEASIERALNTGRYIPPTKTTTPRNAGGRLPTRGNGGTLNPYSAYGVHDTTSPEIAMFDNGMSMLLTGRSGGRIVKIVNQAAAPNANFAGTDPAAAFGGTIEGTDAARAARKAEIKKETDNTLKDMQEVYADQEEYEAEHREKVREAEDKYQRDILLDAQKFAHDRTLILEEGNESLLDSIRRGDGAAAVAAVRETKKKLREQEYQRGIEDEEREYTYKETVENLKKEREAKLSDFLDRLIDLTEHNQELADEQAEADQAELDEQTAQNRALEEQQARTNAEIAASAEETGKTALQGATDTLNAIETVNQASTNFVNGILSAFNSLFSTSIPMINAGQIPQATTNDGRNVGGNLGSGLSGRGGVGIGSSGGGNVNNGNATLPANPSPLDQWTDSTGKLWIWNGRSWIPATAVKQHLAGGGNFNFNSAFRVHDTNRPELMTLDNGQSLMLSGRNSGRVIPLPSLETQNRSGAVAMQNYKQPTPISINIGDINSQANDSMEVANFVVDLAIERFKTITGNSNKNKNSSSLLDIKNR